MAKQYNEGKAEGLAEGEAKGEARGEAKAKIETAKKMLQAGLDSALISKVTELSIAEINKLLK